MRSKKEVNTRTSHTYEAQARVNVLWSWQERHNPDSVSAIQGSFHLGPIPIRCYKVMSPTILRHDSQLALPDFKACMGFKEAICADSPAQEGLQPRQKLFAIPDPHSQHMPLP